MLWLGGEPLIRTGLLREGLSLFRRNAVFTNGLRAVPRDLGCGVLVSLDGPRETNDALRGPGTWDRVTANLAAMDRPVVHCTITAKNPNIAGPLLESLDGLVGGVIFGLYTPRRGEDSEHVLSVEARHESVATLRGLGASWDGLLLNTAGMLDSMDSDSAEWRSACPYRGGQAVALDHRLQEKRPCSYGRGADCERCGCVATHLRAAAKRGDPKALAILRAVFSTGV